MTIQILTLYLKPDVHLTGEEQDPACRQTLAALSMQLKATNFLHVTLVATQAKSELLIGANHLIDFSIMPLTLLFRPSAYCDLPRSFNIFDNPRTLISP